MTKKSDNSWFQFDSNVVCTVSHIRKTNFSELAFYVTFLDDFVLHAHWKLNQHNQNFMILTGSLHNIMSKLLLNLDRIK